MTGTALVPLRFFLDESGSSGDAVRTGVALDFSGQPIFVLAALGIADSEALGAELALLAKRHGLKSGEIKSSALVHVPGFAEELSAYLARVDSPIFLEVMDKRFLLVANLINQIVMPPVPGFDETADAQWMRAMFGDIINDTLPDAVLLKFAAACETPSRSGVEDVFKALRGWAANDPALGGFRETLIKLLDDSSSDFEEDQRPDAHRRWLPLPDDSVTGRPIWILPGLSALTNIYARINESRRGALAGVEMIHDEHMLYGQILSEAKTLMEQLSADGILPAMRNADFQLREHATLKFQQSRTTPGIQAADVIGGFVMRFVRDLLYGAPPAADRVRAMAAIMALSKPDQAQGLNFVAPRRALSKLGIGWR